MRITERIIEFARLNERVKKDGANNPHKVIDKLARKTDNNSRLAIAHSAEIVEVSNFESNNPTHTHQWLDENGWEYRNVYLINRKGEIYKATLNIGKSKDGRNILYDINKISNIGHGAVFSNGVEKIDTKRNSLINPNVVKTNVSLNTNNVNEKFYIDEDTDKKAGAIHDTLKYLMDEEYDDWLVNDDGKNNINDLIKEAVALETTGKIGFYYLDKKRTQNIFKKSGYQLPSQLNNSGSNIIVRTIDDNVNKKINNITQSKQFIRWFGDWQNSPAKASKAVDSNS